MKRFYTLGEHITAEDPRGFLKFGPRIIPNEILESLQKLKEIKLFLSKEHAQQYPSKNAKKDGANEVVSISPCIEVYVINDAEIQNLNVEYLITPNQMTNIIICNASVDIPAAMNECEYRINDRVRKEMILSTYDYFSDAALANLPKILHKDNANMAQVIANYFNGYVEKGMKHSIPENELENKLLYAAVSVAAAFYKVDHQDWATTIAKTLIANAQWDIAAINYYLLEQRQNFFKDKKNDPIKSIFLKKLDGILVALYKFVSEPDIEAAPISFVDAQLSPDTVAPAAVVPLIPHADEPKESSKVIAETSDELKPPAPSSVPAKDDDFAISFTFGAPLRMFKPVLPQEEKTVDQHMLLEELFKRAKENPELGKYLLDKAKEFEARPARTPIFIL